MKKNVFLQIAMIIFTSQLSMSSFAESKQSTMQFPDSSYTYAKLQPSYAQCIQKSDSVTFKLNDCITEEFDYHQKRVHRYFENIINLPDSVSKDKLMNEIADWWVNTKKYCTSEILDEQSCNLNRIANLADKIQND